LHISICKSVYIFSHLNPLFWDLLILHLFQFAIAMFFSSNLTSFICVVMVKYLFPCIMYYVSCEAFCVDRKFTTPIFDDIIKDEFWFGKFTLLRVREIKCIDKWTHKSLLENTKIILPNYALPSPPKSSKFTMALFTSPSQPKIFLFHPSHQIFRHMHRALNVGKKDN
jgi:hypothetical protein